VGPVTARKLRQAGIERLVDVRVAEPAKLHQAVGGMADWLRQLARGEDPREVSPDRPTRSVSAENTYAEDLLDAEAMRGELDGMARGVAAGLERKGLTARTVTIKVRYSDFTTVTRSHTAEPPTRDPARIAERAVALLDRTEAKNRAVRLLGAGAHGLVEDQAEAAPPQDPVLPLGL
jgi:DNA polymerase-4